MFDSALLEPAKYYEAQLKHEFEMKAERFFDELVFDSAIKADDNRAASARYRKLQAEADEKKKKLNLKKFWRGFVVFFGIL